jgi:hypothetical protein
LLRFSMQEAFRIDSLSLDPTGYVNPKTGIASIHGKVVCSGTTGEIELGANLSQRVGRTLITGQTPDFVIIDHCSGEVTWSATIPPGNGLFVGGRAHVSAVAQTIDGNQTFAEGIVRLVGRKAKT